MTRPFARRTSRSIQRAIHPVGTVLVAVLLPFLLIQAGAAQAAPAPQFEVSADPPLIPAFEPTIRHYVVRCEPGVPTGFELSPGPGVSAGFDGGPLRRRAIDHQLALRPGQAVGIVSHDAESDGHYTVRCLPPNFPAWTYARLRKPAAAGYLLAPTIRFGNPNIFGSYVAYFDSHGVPIWWFRGKHAPRDQKMLGPRTFAMADWRSPGDWVYRVLRLDGTPVRQLQTVGSKTDPHDMLDLGEGHFMLLTHTERQHVDLTPYGGSADAGVLDSVLQEVDENGNVVWSWNSGDHIGLGETRRWWHLLISNKASPYDVSHLNSMDVSGNTVMVSMRNNDAVFGIDRIDGSILWKLGGVRTPESLEVIGDRYAYPLAGQHYARFAGDGTITIHDNGTGTGRPPRAVRYRIDPEAGTATLLDDIQDPDVTISRCCGSAVRGVDGSWMMAWGGGPIVTEFTAGGERTFLFDFGELSNYRAVPVPVRETPPKAFGAAMELMHPRGPGCLADPIARTSIGTQAAEELTGVLGSDLIFARGSSDVVAGDAGGDCLYGELGNDRIDGGAGPDLLSGEAGADRLRGWDGSDQLIGGTGPDRLQGGRGADRVRCGPGSDVVVESGADRIAGDCEQVVQPGVEPSP